MKRGGTFLSAVAILALAACSASKLEVRAIPSAIAPGAKPLDFRLAEAHGQLALGNVALALESYRKAMREDPQSADAVAGLAVCYDRMGRYDLSRRYYEMALAIEPGDPHLLAAFAASLDQQGKVVEAARVRAEVRARTVTVPLPAQPPADAPLRMETAPLAVAEANSARLPSVAFHAAPEPVAKAAPTTVEVTAAAVAIAPVEPDIGRSVTVTLPPPRPAPVQVAAVTTAAPFVAPEPKAEPKPVAVAQAKPPADDPLRIETAPVAVAGGGTAKLPTVAFQADVESQAVVAPRVAPTPKMAAAQPPKAGARLERLSLNEVALVTSGAPQWQPKLVAQGPRSATVRFVPLQRPDVRMAAVRLLNAARFRGLAARTRSYLVDRGWRSLAIGDADSVRARSVVLYPASMRTLGRRVAAQFGFTARPVSEARQITVLLGRDAANHPLLRARS